MSRILSLSDWNEVLVTAKKAAEKYGIGWRSYKMYDGAKGIEFFLTDIEGKQYGDSYYSGIWNTKSEYLRAVNDAAQCIVRWK